MRTVLTMVLLLAALASPGGVFDDALFWVRGPVDLNGDGWIKTTRNNANTKDLPDAL